MAVSTSAQYVRGEWTALVTENGTALLHPSIDEAQVRGVWAALSSGAGVSGCLEVLAAGGLAALPPFALVQHGQGELRLLVRGEVQITAGEQVVGAAGIATWREALVPGESYRISAAADGGGPAWPITAGVVLAAQVEWLGAAQQVTGAAPVATEAAAAVAGGLDEAAQVGVAAADAAEDEPADGGDVPAPDEPAGAGEIAASEAATSVSDPGATTDHGDAPEVVSDAVAAEAAPALGDGRAQGSDAVDGLDETDQTDEGEQSEQGEQSDEAEITEVAAEAVQAADATAAESAAAEAAGAEVAEPDAAEADVAGQDRPDAEAAEDESSDADDGVLIDSLPWAVGSADRPQTAAQPGEPATAAGSAASGADATAAGSAASGAEAPGAAPAVPQPDAPEDDLPEHTVLSPRGPNAAAQAAAAASAPVPPWQPPVDMSRPSGPVPPYGQGDVDIDGDHDGQTVMVSELPKDQDMTIVPGMGDTDLYDEPGHPPAGGPALSLSVSTGAEVPLDRPVLIGRAPESARFSAGVQPRLVTVPSPEQDISRTHVEVRAEGSSAVVTDLNSTNGTVVVQPGAAPRRLHAGEGASVPAGTLIDLGDGVTVNVHPTDQGAR